MSGISNNTVPSSKSWSGKSLGQPANRIGIKVSPKSEEEMPNEHEKAYEKWLQDVKENRPYQVEACQKIIEDLKNIFLKKGNCLQIMEDGLDIPNDIWKMICQCQSLKTLCIEGNQLKELPLEIGQLTNLTSISLCTLPHLKSLPESFGNLKQLQSLEIYNGLNKLPDNIGNLENLEKLELCGNNDLTHLPVSIGNLKKLKKLLLENTKIKYQDIPEEIRNLPDIVIDIKPKKRAKPEPRPNEQAGSSSSNRTQARVPSSPWMSQDVIKAFKVFGLRQTATFDEVKKARGKLVLEHHPDKEKQKGWTPEEATANEDKMKKINPAYTILENYFSGK